ncbi:hypothetical protein [Pustulibacterium marinum]|nr:hypothetical protein [Pustulibacterium marinum]
MKKLLFMVAMVLLSSTGFMNAQHQIEDLQLTYGEELDNDGYKILKIFGEKNDKIFALALKGKKDFALKTFDSETMQIIGTYSIEFPELKDKDLDFEEIYMLNNKIYALGSVYSKKEKTYRLVGTELSEEGVLGNGVILFESTVDKNSQRGSFYYKKGVNENELLIMHTSYFKKEDAFKYELKLFNDNMEEVFSDIDKVQFDDNKKDFDFNIADFEVNFNGDVFLVTNESYRDKKKKEKVEKFQVFAYKREKSYAKEVIDIQVKDKEIINCELMSTNQNTLKLVGFFSSVRESGRANRNLRGVYEGTIDLTGATEPDMHFNDFDYETKEKLLGERKAKKDKDLKPLYRIHSLIEKEDGGLLILSEYAMVIIGDKSGIGPLGVRPITYVTNEIIVTSLNPDGSIAWTNVVAKDQDATVTELSFNIFFIGSSGNVAVGAGFAIPLTTMGKGPEYLSAIPMYEDGKLYVLFNDNKKNMGVTDMDEIKNMGNYNKAIPTLFIFDENGNLERKDPEEILKNELVIRPGVFYRKSPKDYIIYASRKREDKLGRLKLEAEASK